ncbi:MAG: CDP-paratose 2-epimerase [Candidatus Rokuibacteriota bacterium]|nr:MAG: CDP-paratose 2-epimerase [Candidatus Rokubacteria bacterium]
MPDHILESRVWLPKPRAEVFAFFAEPANLALLTPGWLGFRLLTERPVMAPYAVFDARLRWLGMPIAWRTMIREYDPPARFLDVQVRGPYDRWEHRHLFLEEAGGTWVEDRVAYRLPLGPLGRLVHAAIVERQLAAIWTYRRQRLSALIAPAYDSIP